MEQVPSTPPRLPAAGDVARTDASDERSAASPIDGKDATRRQIRGSSLLLGGRMLSLGVNFLTQVLIVRYLTKAEFGAFSYGLSIVALGEALCLLGLDKGLSRFLPIYDERREYSKLFGTLIMVLGSVVGLGLGFVLLAVGLNGFASGELAQGEALTVILILACLSPVQALDSIFMGTFAVFSKPRAIFFRKYVLAPGLRLAAIGLVILTAEGVQELAIGYVVSGALGILLYVVMLLQSFRADGQLQHLRLSRLSFPVREVYGFALPLVVVDLLFVVMNTTNVWMLQHFGSPTDIADYRVVQPAAKLNTLVMTSFAMLFTPLAARLFARDDRKGIAELYWRTAAWIAIFSFPIFALTFASSEPLTVALFGAQYESSAAILSLLALGYYFNAALGFNGLTLRVFGFVRYTVIISVAAAVANVAINLLLIPAYGAIGAAVGTAVTLVIHNILKQAGLRKGTGISVFDREHLLVYGAIGAMALALLGLDLLIQPGLLVAIVMVGLGSAALLLITRRSLRAADTFPELLRIPILRRLVA